MAHIFYKEVLCQLCGVVRDTTPDFRNFELIAECCAEFVECMLCGNEKTAGEDHMCEELKGELILKTLFSNHRSMDIFSCWLVLSMYVLAGALVVLGVQNRVKAPKLA